MMNGPKKEAADHGRAQILLVDDEAAIRDSLAPYLERAGFTVRVASNGEEALQACASFLPDLVVCDVLMPKLDGREVVRQLREGGNWTPVILLTKVGESFERTAALNEGADDYLNKPFDPQELVARIQSILRRIKPGERSLSSSDFIRCGPLLADRAARRFWLDGSEITLTPKASLLLDYLMTHPGELHTRERLLSALWGFEFPVNSRAVDHRVAEIRRELNDDPASPTFIETAQTMGYRFCGTVTREDGR